MATPIIPPRLAKTIVEVHGTAGRAWMKRLPVLLEGWAARWRLVVGPPFPGLSYNLVLEADRRDGTPVVLKMGPPNKELTSEAAALRHYNAHGAARLLEADEENGALLLERLEPGRPLWHTPDEEAIPIAAGVMRGLWRPLPAAHTFPSVADWGEGFQRLRRRFDGGTGPLPPALVEEAESLFADLVASSEPSVLLHGDLHHGNILSAARAPYLAIDPKGVVGEPAYEPGAFLRCPISQLLKDPDPKGRTARRLDAFAAALNLDRDRIRAWAFAQAILSAWWMIEDHGTGSSPDTFITEILREV